MRFTKLIQQIQTVFLLAVLLYPAFIWGANKNHLCFDLHGEWNYVPGEVIVKLKHAVPNAQATLGAGTVFAPTLVLDARPLFPQNAKEKLRKAIPDDLSRIYKFAVAKETDIRLLCQKLVASGQVEYAEPNYLLPVEAVPNDSLYDQLWHLKQIQAEKAWDIAKGSSSVIIAIIDTGVDWDHPDLSANIWHNAGEVLDGLDNDGNGFIDDIRGWDFVDDVSDYAAGEDGIKEDNNPMDFDGHGTFVAGLAAATTNNRIGVSSISWGCRIMPLRAGYKSLSGGVILLDAAASAIEYAASNGADVVNLSTSGAAYTIVEVARFAFEHDVVVTNSAGNMPQTPNTPDLLELEPFVLVVAAVDNQDRRASFSHYYEQIDVSAPGTSISSTYFDDRYSAGSGTSYAAPIVAGLAGLIKSHNPNLSAFEILYRIVGTTDNIDALNPAYAGKLGSGRINAYRALTEQVQPQPQISIKSLRIDDSIGGNGNGILDPGEKANLIFALQNDWGDAGNVTASLNIEHWAINLTKAQAVFGAIPGLSKFPNNIKENDSDPFVFSVSEGALPQVVHAKVDITDANGGRWSSEIDIPISPSILLVDDDDGENNVESYYTSVLDSLGFTYKVWDHLQQGSPAGILPNYSTVIWLCEWNFPSLDSLDRAIIADYLDHGGRLFLSGQDIGWDLCEDPGTEVSNEFEASGGASKQFYEKYLHARYIADASQYSILTGVDDDPISNGLNINVFQPGRPSEYQFPSEIEPKNGSVAVLTYPNNRKGAVRYAGDYRLVYFAFGGFEAITSAETRRSIMPKILNWLNDFSIEHEPLRDTENTQDAYPVLVKAVSGLWPIQSIRLLWSLDGALPYQSVEMTKLTESSYLADIPAQLGGRVAYTFYIRLLDGYVAPIYFYHFNVGPDLQPPELQTMLALRASLSKHDIDLAVQVTDATGIDSNSVYLHYASRRGGADSLLMAKQPGNDQFDTALPGPFGYGDSVFYHFSACDLARARNRAVTATDTLIIGLDDFENGVDNWVAEPPESWGLDGSQKHSGSFSVNDSPFSELVPGQTATLTLARPLDFSASTDAKFSYWTRYNLRDQRDYAWVEISADSGSTWERMGEQMTGLQGDWQKIDFNLANYLRQGKSRLTLRFKIVTSSEVNLVSTGWYVDDVQVTENLEVGVPPVKEDAALLPKHFALGLNYPNPFNPSTRITFAVAEPARVKLEIFNSVGQRLRTLVNEHAIPGFYEQTWDGKDDRGRALGAGIYFVRLEAGEFQSVRKIALVR